MDSLVAHLAGRQRDAIRLRRVDVDERPDLAARFGISQVPTIALVRGKRIVARVEGRSTAPKLEALLREHLGAA
jgi:thioredoxin-like negative regulator of GroEL